MPVTIDVRGKVCPQPVLEAQKKLHGLSPGEILEIIGDDPGMEEDFKLFCQSWGHTLLSITQEKGGIIRVSLCKGK